jgi:hypothetical protein
MISFCSGGLPWFFSGSLKPPFHNDRFIPAGGSSHGWYRPSFFATPKKIEET